MKPGKPLSHLWLAWGDPDTAQPELRTQQPGVKLIARIRSGFWNQMLLRGIILEIAKG
jgi:hypothetical protein